MTTPAVPCRTVAGAQVAVGAALLVAPAQVLTAVGAGRNAPRSAIVRLLGGRMVAQGAVTMLVPRRRVTMAGVAVDAAHAASMVALAAAEPRYRRAALASAACASLFAVSAALVGRSQRERHVTAQV